MSQMCNQTDLFKLALEWEDDDEVVVKVEPMEEACEEEESRNAPVVAADEDDLIPMEDWTLDGNLILRSYVNKTKASLGYETASEKTHSDIEEITFRIEEDHSTGLTNVFHTNTIDINERFSLENVCADNVTTPCSTFDITSSDNSSGCRKDLRTGADNGELSDQLLGYYHSDKNDVDAITEIENIKSPAVTTPVTKVVDKNTDACSQKVIYLTKVPKELVLQMGKTVTKLPGKCIVQKSESLTKSVTTDVKKPPIYTPNIVAGVFVGNQSVPRSYLKQTDEAATARKPRFFLSEQSTDENISIQNKVRIFMSSKNRGRPKGHVAFNVPLVLRTAKRGKSRHRREEETISECPTCRKVFKKQKHFRVHLKIHLDTKRDPPTKECLVCGKMFRDNTQLSVHSRVHSGITPYHCKLCEKVFKHQTSLARHTLSHTQERKYLCHYVDCAKTYRNNSDLINHHRTHTKEKPFACCHCGKKFSDRCARNSHERIHDPVKKYWCEVCHRKFTQSSTLKSHMVTHTDLRPFECSSCDMKFKSKVVLKSHIRTHSASKTFKCQICEEMFSENRTLRRHIFTHKGFEKPFPCAFCKRWYFREDRWKAHVETHNMNVERPFACDLCPKRYSNQGYLRLHQLKLHEPKADGGISILYECSARSCNEKFKTFVALQRHMTTNHQLNKILFQCDTCKGTFPKKEHLKRHLAKNHMPDSVDLGPLPVIKMKKSKVKPLKNQIIVRNNNAKGDKNKTKVDKKDQPDVLPQCGSCEKVFRHKSTLARHLKGVGNLCTSSNV